MAQSIPRPNSPIIAYHYLRFSTPEQGEGNSFQRQYERAKEWCEKNGVMYNESFRFEDLGVSGFSGENRRKGALSAFLEKVHAGKIPPGSLLLFEAWDRLSREGSYEALNLLVSLINAGIVLIHLRSRQRIDRKALNKDTLLTDILADFRLANMESAQKSDRLGYSWDSKRRNSAKILTTLCPAWLRATSDKKGFELIPDRADIVRQIVTQVLEGKGAQAVANALNRSGVDTWGVGKKKGRLWHKSYIAKILRNPALIGDLQPHKMVDGKRIPSGDLRHGYFPAVISADEWEQLQPITRPSKIIRGRTGKNIANLFQGLAVDEETKMPMVRQMKGYGIALFSPATGGAGWRYDHFEACVLLFFRYLDVEALLAEKQNDVFLVEKEIQQLQSDRDKCQVAIDNLIELVETSADGASSKALADRLGKREKELMSLDSRLLTLRHEVTRSKPTKLGTPSLKDFCDRKDDPEVRLRIRHQLRQLLKGIEVNARVQERENGAVPMPPRFEHDAFMVTLQTKQPVFGPYRTFTLLFKNGAKRIVSIPMQGKALVFQSIGDTDEPGGFGSSVFNVPPYPQRGVPQRDGQGHFIKAPLVNTTPMTTEIPPNVDPGKTEIMAMAILSGKDFKKLVDPAHRPNFRLASEVERERREALRSTDEAQKKESSDEST